MKMDRPKFKEELRLHYARNLERVTEGGDLYRVIHPFMVYKRLQATRHNGSDYIIARMEVPVGTYMNIPDTVFTSKSKDPEPRKMRANKLIPREMVSKNDYNGEKVKQYLFAYASWERDFIYYLNRLAVPSLSFDSGREVCSTGLHCYFNEEDARSH